MSEIIDNNCNSNISKSIEGISRIDTTHLTNISKNLSALSSWFLALTNLCRVGLNKKKNLEFFIFAAPAGQ